MAELTKALVSPIAKTKILTLAYTVSGVIDLTRVDDKIYQGGQLVKLLRVLNDSDSLLSFEDEQQIIQGLIGIGKLKI